MTFTRGVFAARYTMLLLGGALIACFADEGGGSQDAEESGANESSGSTDGGETGGNDSTLGTSASGSSSSGGTGTLEETDGTGDSSSSSTGHPACAPGDCPSGSYCIHGICEPTPADMIEVPEGAFYRGCNDPDCDTDESPPDPALHLATFAIDRLEVTAGAYQLCVDAGACTEPGAGPECNGDRSGYTDHPINCVDWNQADAYCAWAGKQLPTEAQWEKAGRGVDGRRQPWGAANADCTTMVKYANGPGCGTGETWPVGSKPAGASPFGLLNVAGNVREWTADWHGSYTVGVADPTGPASGIERVARGLSYVNGSNASIRIGNRSPTDPAAQLSTIGFRCALSG